MGLEHNDCASEIAAASDMIWEGSPVAVENSSFPEVRGRTRFDTASVGEMDAVTDRGPVITEE